MHDPSLFLTPSVPSVTRLPSALLALLPKNGWGGHEKGRVLMLVSGTRHTTGPAALAWGLQGQPRLPPHMLWVTVVFTRDLQKRGRLLDPASLMAECH